MVVGADNLLDTNSEKIANDWTGEYSSFGIKYPENSPFDTNGGFYYGKAGVSM